MDVCMPFVMLRSPWPGTFRRAIMDGGSKRTLEFKPAVPVDLTPFEIEQLKSDIGLALVPVEFDEKARPRVITDDVVADEAAELTATAPTPDIVTKPRRGRRTEQSSEPADAD